MDFTEIIKKSKSKVTQTNLLTCVGVEILYYSNINNLEDLEKYNINIFKDIENDNYKYKIYFIEDIELYNEAFKVLENEKYKKIQMHSATKYKLYNDSEIRIYLSDNYGQEYLVIKKSKDIFIIAKQRDDSRCLMYVIREIIRLSAENQKNIILHSAYVQTEKNNILILGDSGSGKTTLLFQILDKRKSKFISNDRTLINGELKAHTFPIKIRIGVETINNIKSLYNYMKLKKLSDGAKEKVSIYPLDIENWKKQCAFKDNKISKIIIPHIQPNVINTVRKLEIKSAQKVIERNCYTPDDPEWKNRWFIEDYIFSEKEMINNKDTILKKLMEETNIYKLDYNGILDDEIFNKILED